MIPFKTRIKSGVVQRLEVIESLSFQGQELTPGAATDEKTKVSSNDTTAGYLNGKLVAGSGIVLTENNNGGDETLTISANAVDLDVKTSVSATDTTAGFLNGKLVAGSNITLTQNNTGGNETLTIAASGLTGFTGSQNTASPNNTVNASRLLVDAASTNADFVIQPKGSGALLAQLPDNATTGGNKRGARAIDLQTTRTSNSQVASGVGSIILNGDRNTASGQFAIAGGSQNTASGAFSGSVALGYLCTASGDPSIALGYSNSATGNGSVAIGDRLTASANYSIALGQESVANRIGMYTYAAGRFSANGDCQYERYVVRRLTTDATPTELTCNGTAPAATVRIGIASDATYTFSAFVTARRTDADNESACWEIKGGIDNNAGTTAFVGTPVITQLGKDISAWAIVVEADNTNDALVLKVTGENGKTIRWGAVVELMKVGG